MTTANSQSPAIALDDVWAGYRENPVLRGLSLHIASGEMTSILGPNGAGKTTLLRVITGLLRPARGTVRLFGEELFSLPAARRASLVGVVPQSIEVPMAFTVAEIVMMGRTAILPRWRLPSTEDRRSAERAMVYTDVVDLRNRPFSDLSGGERQRAIIAMVLAQEPRMILLDEATSHLDINHRFEVMQIVERLNHESGTTIVMVSHDLNLSAEFCRRILLLDHGNTAADGSPAAVLTADNIRRVYHCDVRVQRDTATGTVAVSSAPRKAAGTGTGLRVHVVAGGGSAAEILRRLSLAGHSLTCGVLNRRDSDTDAAEVLGIPVAAEKPFSPLGTDSIRQAREMIASCNAVVVTGVPFGPGNVANLDLAIEALAAGKKVLIMDGISDRDYTPDRAASHRAADLLARGALRWSSVAELEPLLATPFQVVSTAPN